MVDFGQHPRGVRLDNIKHACPECPTPFARVGELQLPPRPDCRWCHGTGLLSEAELYRWQVTALARQ
jgi:hypothetical protein